MSDILPARALCILIVFCQTVPHAKGQDVVSSVRTRSTTPKTTVQLYTQETATDDDTRSALTEPALLAEDSSTAESSLNSSEDGTNYDTSLSEHDFTSSDASSSLEVIKDGKSLESREDLHMNPTTISSNQEEIRSTQQDGSSNMQNDPSTTTIDTRTMIASTTSATVTSDGSNDASNESTESNCTERPFIDMSRTKNPHQQSYHHHQRRKYLQTVRTARAERKQRTSDARLHSARSGAGQELYPMGDEEELDVELYAAQYGYRIYRLEGDLMLTLIVETDDFGATLFTIDRINDLRLVGGSKGNTSIGVNIIHLLNTSLSQRTLQQEVNVLKECSTNTIGIFVSPRLWASVRLLSETLDYNIFPLPSTYDLLFTKAAHLLYELPWTNGNSSAMVYSGSNELSTRFSTICRHEHLCLENYPSSDTIYILLGLEPAISFAMNGTLVLVLTGNDRLYLPDLPNGAYVIEETELNVASLGYSWERYGTSIHGSELLSASSLLLEVIDLLNRSGSDCRNASIECMNNWKYHAKRSTTELLNVLQLKNATQSIKFELRQKRVGDASSVGNRTESTDIEHADENQLKLIASSNAITNYTTVYERLATNTADAPSKLGSIFYCAKEFEIRHPDFIERHHRPVYYGGAVPDAEEYGDMYWQIKMEAWVAAGLTVSSLGILLCAAILIFLIVRVCMDDILEGHPLGSILLLVSLILQFAAFIPFSLEYTGYTADLAGHRTDAMLTWNAHCTVKIFLVSMCYCMTFSLLLCRAIMLASIGSEGGFLSHINGYIQSVICGFSTLVQLGLSTQLVIVLHANSHSISCGEIYYGHWFWAVIAYDGVLLVSLIFLAPFIFRSQRNYREGLLLVTGSVLCLVIWTVWIPLCMFGYEWREAAISLGLVATALAVLVGIMIPRCFLMVRSIARSDLVQALPSLTSLAFAQANQFISDQSVYECVNPAMRQRSPTDDSFVMDQDLDEAYSANSEIPTLPLRGQRRLRQENGTITMSTSNGTITGNHNGTIVSPMDRPVGNVTHIAPNFYGISNPYSCTDSLTSISPNKITRF
ncbi:protein bride of sevenless [Anopheles maculipalpis]|uniref:protein bride of sevenless n=1 Tax=Anopheles maculipalpis TaxID=1496333 RepID=UPI0021595B60|nr:protein bride of sevenless [Anopheles maculipalpis]